MRREQRIVAVGAVSGVIFMIFSVWLLARVLPVPLTVTMGDRLAYALKWDALAAVPFFVMIVFVGNERFFSDAIDPTLGKESQRMIVDGRVADNTTQQLLLFAVGSLSLAANLSPQHLPVVGAAAITFFIVRVAFWIGYRIDPLYRAFGFAGTAYLNLCVLTAALWMSLF
jgi:hypothetical protein